MSRRAVTIEINKMPPCMRATALRMKELEREWKRLNATMNRQLRDVYGVEPGTTAPALLCDDNAVTCGDGGSGGGSKKRKCALQAALDERQHFIDVSRDPRRVVTGYTMRRLSTPDDAFIAAVPPAAPQQIRAIDSVSVAELQLQAQRLFGDLDDDDEKGVVALREIEEGEVIDLY